MDLAAFLIKTLELRRNQRRSRAELEAPQAVKLRRLATYAYRRSPYYRDLIRECAIDPAACRVDQFPVLTKRDVIAHFDSIATDPRVTAERARAFLARSTDPTELMAGRFHVVHTSGSSGEVGIFAYSRDDWARGPAQVSRLHRMGLRRRRVTYFGAVKGHFAGVSIVSSALAGAPRLFYDTLVCDINQPLANAVDRLNRFRPHLLTGYATGLLILAEQQRAGALRIAPEALHSSGEPLAPQDRALLDRSFEAPCFNVYASTEHMLMGASEAGARGLILFEDDLTLELQADRTYVTNLFNFTMPLIRYRMSDIMATLPSSDTMDPYRRVDEIVGRAETIPWFRNVAGVLEFVSPLVIVEIYVPGVRRFQMEVLDDRSFVFRYCIAQGTAGSC